MCDDFGQAALGYNRVDYNTFDVIADGRVIAQHEHKPPAEPWSLDTGVLLELEKADGTKRKARIDRVIRIAPGTGYELGKLVKNGARRFERPQLHVTLY